MARPNDSSRRDQPDTQWLERMYNNRMRVPEHGEYFARWAAESALVRRALACELDVPYGDAPRERLDAFAAPRKGAPLVVFMHGGYWKALDKSFHSFIAGAAHALGAATVIPSYTLCPQARIGDITLQMARAVAWAWRHARTLNADPRRISVVGYSAGGQLAAMMLTCAWNVLDPALPRDVVKRALGLSGLYDLQPLLHVPSLQEVLRLDPAQVAACSPARLPAPTRGQLFSLVGGDESGEYLRLNRLIQQSWGRERVPLAQVLPGLNHFSLVDALVDPKQRAHRVWRQVIG